MQKQVTIRPAKCFWLVTAVLVVLKITEALSWNWFWVFSPVIFLYGSFFGLFFFVVMLMYVTGNGHKVKWTYKWKH